MKRGTPNHPKVLRLMDELNTPSYIAIGVLESIWQFTAQYARNGAIGKWPNTAIARGIGWEPTDADRLIEALVQSTWLDESDNYRLIVHDWSQHCDVTTHLQLARNGEMFADGSKPSVSKLSKNEREQIQSQKPLTEICAQKAHDVRTPSALPILSYPILTDPNLADTRAREKKSASSHLTKQTRRKNQEPSSAGAVAAAVVSNTAPFEPKQFRARTVSDTADEIIALTGEPHWRAWWTDVGGTLFDSGDGWPMLCEHVDKLRVASNPEQRRALDVGVFDNPGGYLVSRVTAWMKERKLRWPGFPERGKNSVLHT